MPPATRARSSGRSQPAASSHRITKVNDNGSDIEAEEGIKTRSGPKPTVRRIRRSILEETSAVTVVSTPSAKTLTKRKRASVASAATAAEQSEGEQLGDGQLTAVKSKKGTGATKRLKRTSLAPLEEPAEQPEKQPKKAIAGKRRKRDSEGGVTNGSAETQPEREKTPVEEEIRAAPAKKAKAAAGSKLPKKAKVVGAEEAAAEPAKKKRTVAAAKHWSLGVQLEEREEPDELPTQRRSSRRRSLLEQQQSAVVGDDETAMPPPPMPQSPNAVPESPKKSPSEPRKPPKSSTGKAMRRSVRRRDALLDGDDEDIADGQEITRRLEFRDHFGNTVLKQLAGRRPAFVPASPVPIPDVIPRRDPVFVSVSKSRSPVASVSPPSSTTLRHPATPLSAPGPGNVHSSARKRSSSRIAQTLLKGDEEDEDTFGAGLRLGGQAAASSIPGAKRLRFEDESSETSDDEQLFGEPDGENEDGVEEDAGSDEDGRPRRGRRVRFNVEDLLEDLDSESDVEIEVSNDGLSIRPAIRSPRRRRRVRFADEDDQEESSSDEGDRNSLSEDEHNDSNALGNSFLGRIVSIGRRFRPPLAPAKVLGQGRTTGGQPGTPYRPRRSTSAVGASSSEASNPTSATTRPVLQLASPDEIPEALFTPEQLRAGVPARVVSVGRCPGLPTVQIANRVETVFGRVRGCDVVLRAPADAVQQWEGVSRRHAKVVRTGKKQFVLVDLDSSNGVFVNGRRVREAVLRNGDLIMFGGPSNVAVGQYVPYLGAGFLYRFDQLSPALPQETPETPQPFLVGLAKSPAFLLALAAAVAAPLSPQIQQSGRFAVARQLLEPLLAQAGVTFSAPVLSGLLGVSTMALFALVHALRRMCNIRASPQQQQQ